MQQQSMKKEAMNLKQINEDLEIRNSIWKDLEVGKGRKKLFNNVQKIIDISKKKLIIFLNVFQ